MNKFGKIFIYDNTGLLNYKMTVLSICPSIHPCFISDLYNIWCWGSTMKVVEQIWFWLKSRNTILPESEIKFYWLFSPRTGSANKTVVHNTTYASHWDL